MINKLSSGEKKELVKKIYSMIDVWINGGTKTNIYKLCIQDNIKMEKNMDMENIVGKMRKFSKVDGRMEKWRKQEY